MWTAILLLFYSFLSSTSALSPTTSPTVRLLVRCGSEADKAPNYYGVMVNCSGKLTGEQCTLLCKNSDLTIVPNGDIINCDAIRSDHSLISGDILLERARCQNNDLFSQGSCQTRCDNGKAPLFRFLIDMVLVPPSPIKSRMFSPDESFQIPRNYNTVPFFPQNVPWQMFPSSNPSFFPNDRPFQMHQLYSPNILISQLPRLAHSFIRKDFVFNDNIFNYKSKHIVPRKNSIFSPNRIPNLPVYSQSKPIFSQYRPQYKSQNQLRYKLQHIPLSNRFPSLQSQPSVTMKSGFILEGVSERENLDILLQGMLKMKPEELIKLGDHLNMLDITGIALRELRSRYTANIGGCACDHDCIAFSDCCSDYQTQC